MQSSACLAAEAACTHGDQVTADSAQQAVQVCSACPKFSPHVKGIRGPLLKRFGTLQLVSRQSIHEWRSHRVPETRAAKTRWISDPAIAAGTLQLDL